MIIELGHYALVLALVLTLLQMAPALLGARLPGGVRLARQTAMSVFWLVSISILALLHAYALSDFSVLNVVQNSNTMKPWAYKLTALWGNHEGSMLLWLWMMTGWTALYAVAARRAARDSADESVGANLFPTRVLAVQGALALGFAFFLLATSNPFLRLDPPAPEGLDLNPVLQDPLLILHPPFLYVGVTGFALVFSWAVAALWSGRAGRDFASGLRPWVLWPWAALTVGITLGSFWAYYELGWGGFWFWDPVENISLLPWLGGAALLHSLRAFERRGTLPGWTLLLALICFALAIFGTFLVRSGLLTSVHAFAADPARGVFLLMLVSLVTAGGLALYALRAPRLSPGAPFGWLSRDAAVLTNNVFMSVVCTTVFLGTVYPLLLSALDVAAVSVGTPYYVAVLAPMLLPFALAMGASPLLAWRRTPRAMLGRALRLPAVLTLVGLGVLLLAPVPKNFLVLVGLSSALWIIAATLCDLLDKTQQLRRWRAVTRAQAAMALGHIGFALMIAGATAATQWAQEETLWMKPGQRLRVAQHNLLLLGVETGIGRNYNSDRAVFSLQPVADPAAMRFLSPEKRWYPVQEKQTSESAMAFLGFNIFSVVLGDQDPQDASRWVVRIYYHPWVTFVFLGGLMMALGGGLAALDRKPVRKEPA